ncbi:hypothetical protein SISSUDRAFT_296441 [Sistotremastrum suecicum HHB10207 ss-3]|uniref:F-box domain-containing protein n=1 Tax=Sistotremastrum suecicum HHB10207 ss-3 TaxID=1314776 RepID=A0A165ZHN5_9AGAM|nr:hypothetical protein SISSUDRAFT_296441 [Sistotremastrum suecicum HHB10207 ss-3]
MPQFIEPSRKAPFTPPLALHDERKVDNSEIPDGPTFKLPPELLRIIFEEVASSIRNSKARDHTLYNLLLTSRDLYSEAHRLLYRDIIFVHHSSAAGLIAEALHSDADTCVRSLRVDNFVAVAAKSNRSTRTHFFHLPLNSMGGLRSLDLSGSRIKNPLEVAEFLRTSIPANSLVGFHSRLFLDNNILPFLRQQSNIQFLSILCLNESVSSLGLPQLMPNLKRLTISLLNDVRFQDLVEDRPITVFRFNSFHPLPHYWSKFAPRLHSLDMSLYSPPLSYLHEFLETIAMAAINLRLLFACFEISFLSGR